MSRFYCFRRLRELKTPAIGCLLLAELLTGCGTTQSSLNTTIANSTVAVDRVSASLDKPVVPAFGITVKEEDLVSIDSIRDESASVRYREMSLREVTLHALTHSPVLRDIGGVVLRSPEAVRTAYTQRLQEMDPRLGRHAALSAFDAQLNASANLMNNDRLYNNAFFAGGTNAFQQDQNQYQLELAKRTITGSRTAVRGVMNYDSNNSPANIYPNYWDSWMEGEVRQPLMQGAGMEFNRIAGPGSAPGVYNGLLIARANSDINQYDFTIAMNDFISNVENAYWDLYLSYRELQIRRDVLNQSRAILEIENEKQAKGDENKVLLAKHQVAQAENDLDLAIAGRLISGTQSRNGATAGTLQPGVGVLAAERRLRLLCALEVADGELIRPSDAPKTAPVIFDWDLAVAEAMHQRAELMKQNAVLKKRELELLAARNFLNPQLDAVGRYRFRGFGDSLVAGGNQSGVNSASAIGNLATGDQQEWMLGVELNVPLGYRKAHAAVSHAELQVARERMVLKEQQREILSSLSASWTDMQRARKSMDRTFSQSESAEEYRKAESDPRSNDISVEYKFDAIRRVANSRSEFFKSEAEYAVAVKNFYFERGSVLTYSELMLAESGEVSVPSSVVSTERQSYGLKMADRSDVIEQDEVVTISRDEEQIPAAESDRTHAPDDVPAPREEQKSRQLSGTASLD